MELFQIAGVVIIVCVFITCLFSYLSTREKRKTKEMELKKQILELEVEKQNGNIKLLQEERNKNDKIMEYASAAYNKR